MNVLSRVWGSTVGTVGVQQTLSRSNIGSSDFFVVILAKEGVTESTRTCKQPGNESSFAASRHAAELAFHVAEHIGNATSPTSAVTFAIVAVVSVVTIVAVVTIASAITTSVTTTTSATTKQVKTTAKKVIQCIAKLAESTTVFGTAEVFFTSTAVSHLLRFRTQLLPISFHGTNELRHEVVQFPHTMGLLLLQVQLLTQQLALGSCFV